MEEVCTMRSSPADVLGQGGTTFFFSCRNVVSFFIVISREKCM
jgi:hypothetical protein